MPANEPGLNRPALQIRVMAAAEKAFVERGNPGFHLSRDRLAAHSIVMAGLVPAIHVLLAWTRN